MLNRIIVFILFVFTMSLEMTADNSQHTTPINLSHTHHGGPRNGLPLAFDKPEAYHSYYLNTQEIIIDGGGVVSYYDVVISSPVTNTVEISTQVDGTYDTFDISSLPAGTHVITVESPSGNIYEGTFTTY